MIRIDEFSMPSEIDGVFSDQEATRFLLFEFDLELPLLTMTEIFELVEFNSLITLLVGFDSLIIKEFAFNSLVSLFTNFDSLITNSIGFNGLITLLIAFDSPMDVTRQIVDNPESSGMIYEDTGGMVYDDDGGMIYED